MPVMDGIESARRYRAWEAEQIAIDKNFPRLAIVAMSARNDAETIKEVQDAGMKGRERISFSYSSMSFFLLFFLLLFHVYYTDLSRSLFSFVFSLGIDLFLPKPFRYQDFVSSLQSKNLPRLTNRREAGGDEVVGNTGGSKEK